LAFLSIAFYVSCIHERERRASALAAVMSGVVLVVLVRFLAAALEGLFNTPAGILTLAAICAVLAIGGFLFVRRTAPNARALAGTQGRIEGEVKRFDERARSGLRPKPHPQAGHEAVRGILRGTPRVGEA